MIVAPATHARTDAASSRTGQPRARKKSPPAGTVGPRRGTGVNDAARKLNRRVNKASAGYHDTLVWRTNSDELRRAPIGPHCYDFDLEHALPIRIAYRWSGRKAYSGQHWFSPTGTSLYYESMMERLGMIQVAYHFNRADLPSIVAASSQPVRILFDSRGGCFPDLFCRFSDGTRTVLEVKPRGALSMEKRAEFERTQDICTRIGWQYAAILEPTEVVEYNLYTLAARRQPRFAPPADLRDEIVDLCQDPVPLGEVADTLSPASRAHVSPQLLHLMWMRVIEPWTLQEPLDWATRICVPDLRSSTKAAA